MIKDIYTSSLTDSDPVLANQRLRSKLQYLQRQSTKRQAYLKDIQKTLKLNKQSIKFLNEQGPNDKAIDCLVQQNELLHDSLKNEYDNICRINALYLMQVQLRQQDSKFYNQRINEFEVSMSQLRRYLHDKEESFSCVVEKLKKYEQLKETPLAEKLKGYTKSFLYGSTKDTIVNLTKERDQFKRLYLELQQLSSFNKGGNGNLSISIQNNQSTKNTTKYYSQTQNQNPKSNSKSKSKSRSQQLQQQQLAPNIQLIRLMKKQQLNKEVLQAALADAIDKNITLLNFNRKLHNSLAQLKKENDYIIADMVLLCQKLNCRSDPNNKSRLSMLKRHRTKDDLTGLASYKEIMQKYAQNNPNEARIIVFNYMRQDVQQISQFVNLLQGNQRDQHNLHHQDQKKNYIKSFEDHSIYQKQHNKNNKDQQQLYPSSSQQDNQDYDDEQFSINQI